MRRSGVDWESWPSRYEAGWSAQVWSEMIGLGEAVREPAVAPFANEVAAMTMARVRRNVERLRESLLNVGYRFRENSAAHVPPNQQIREMVIEIESTVGVLPLSLKAFYEHVGTVDFCQSLEQLVMWQDRDEGPPTDEVLYAGEYDPLVVGLLDPEPYDAQLCFFAPDEFHKAGYSGGENYHVRLPVAGADFRIAGMYDIDEWFVDYLRETFRGGGFRGRIVVDENDPDRCRKERPDLDLARRLAEATTAI